MGWARMEIWTALPLVFLCGSIVDCISMTLLVSSRDGILSSVMIHEKK
jgi:hypothetical protein